MAAGAPAGEGLTNMRHRLERMGGACHVTNGGDAGTRVSFHYLSPRREYPPHDH
jgi:signal transduction histidine kinase